MSSIDRLKILEREVLYFKKIFQLDPKMVTRRGRACTYRYSSLQYLLNQSFSIW